MNLIKFSQLSNVIQDHQLTFNLIDPLTLLDILFLKYYFILIKIARIFYL